MSKKDAHLEIAKLIGEPINYQLPVPVELGAVADVIEIEPGEKVYDYTDVEDTADELLTVDDTDGKITTVKRNPLGDTQITLGGLNSKLEYVLVDSILSSPDLQILARRKESITRGMDKRELQTIINGINTATGAVDAARPENVSIPTVSYESGDDIYDLIMKAKQEIEDYGDKYILLNGSGVQNAIDTYEKDKATAHYYNVSLSQKLSELGIETHKIFGKVSLDGSDDPLLDTSTFILLARNSRVATGKPIKFIRRKISADIANLMGADVTKAQRALIVNPTPVQVADSNVLAFGVYGYESIAFCIPNPKAICQCDAASAL